MVMSGETKVGLVVAASFLALVGGVFAVKHLQPTPQPDSAQAAASGPAVDQTQAPAAASALLGEETAPAASNTFTPPNSAPTTAIPLPPDAQSLNGPSTLAPPPNATPLPPLDGSRSTFTPPPGNSSEGLAPPPAVTPLPNSPSHRQHAPAVQSRPVQDDAFVPAPLPP